MARRRLPGIVSLIYTQNPFYLISTCLFVYGLKVLFRVGDSAVLFEKGSVAYMEPWGLLGSFAAVTLLMAVTAVLVVRLGKVWEDARSLVLIVLLMLLAIAVSCDELFMLLSDRDVPREPFFYTLAAGPVFAVFVCEFLIRMLRLKFGAVFRLPLYGFLLLFFLWPALLLQEVTGFTLAETRCLMALFPVAAAFVTLTLLPAVRRGSASVAENGTPWRWPLFPWTPFFFIAVAVCLRSWLLTLSFDSMKLRGHYWDTIFGVYQLVPFALAILVLLLETGRREKIAWLQDLAMLTAPLTLMAAYPLAVPWAHLPTYRQFTLMISNELASPVFLTLIGLALFYLRAWWQGVRGSEFAMTMVVLVLCFAHPHKFGLAHWETDFHPIPMLVLALFHVTVGVYRRRSLNFITGLILVAVVGQNAEWIPQVPQEYQSFASLNALMLGVLLAGLIFNDSFGRLLRSLSPLTVWLTGNYGLLMLVEREVNVSLLAGHVAIFLVMEFSLFRLLSQRGYLWAAIWQSCFAAVGCLALAAQLPSGSRQIVFAILFFVVAVFISALKSGLSRRIRMWWLTQRRSLPHIPM